MSVSDRQDEVVSIPESMPVLPLRDVVIYPGMITRCWWAVPARWRRSTKP